MNQFELEAEPRTESGRGASRRLRRTNKIPGILYGAKQEATTISLDHDNVSHHLEHEAFYSHILTLNLGGEKQRVVLKDLQRHPYKPRILHIDLLRVSETEKLTMRIPLHFTNEDKCLGVKQGGGVISHIMTELEVTCLPKHLPEYIEVNLAEVNLGVTLHITDLILPEGVESYALTHGGDPSAPVVSVHMPKIITEDEPVAEVAAEVAADAAATAAPAAAPAAKDKDVKEEKDKKDKKEK